MQSSWIHCFDDAVPKAVDSEQLEKDNKNITFDRIQEWIEENDGITDRFSFYKSFGRTSFLSKGSNAPFFHVYGGIN